MKGLYAIPLGNSFVEALVQGLITKTEEDPLSLARHLVILPTRRGCLALQEAFLKATPSGCCILPRILALADIEDGGELPGYTPLENLLPAMPTWQRLGLLSQLVLAFEKQKEGGVLNPAGAVRLAQELMRLVDEVETSGLHLNDLKTLVGADYAAHWQLTLDFLKILTDLWPPIMEQAGFMEPAARKRLILDQIATHWQPTYPVILAGTTGTRPSTARLAKSILNFEQGCVVLPGVDRSLSPVERQSLPPTHPQYTLNQLIQQLGTPEIWPVCLEEASNRSVLISKAMITSPQEDWSISPEMGDEFLSNVQAMEAPSILEEARQIALIMRYELEDPEQVIALVTPDVELGRRVRSELGRWGCHANLSSGLPLSQSLVGRFLLLSSLLTQEMSSAELLALLKHPLFAKGGDRLLHLRATRRFEIDVLRKLAPLNIQTLPFPGHEMCSPLLALNDGKLHSFSEYLTAHATVAQALVGSVEGGESILWGEEDGQNASSLWEALKEHADNFVPLTARDYPPLLRHLMAQEVVRDVEGIGSRLLILGALEARLLQADVVILGGLNEGTWPGVTEDDPWLSRFMRESFGLPPLERKIGLSAHDFSTAMTTPKVYMTRSLKRDGAPTLPSRWWQRLSALLATGGHELTSDPSHPWGTWSDQLDQPQNRITFTPPAPCPPLTARPRKLSVTAVETLLRDPYSIYAKTILNLRPIDPLDVDLSMVERGQAIHQVLDQFVQSGVDPASPEAMTTLESLGREAFGDLLADPRAKAFWWPRFMRMGAWFLDQLMKEQPYIQEIKTEIDGKIDIPTANGPIVLTAKADRIDIMSSGMAQIIDYKTGMVPSKKSVTQGTAPQLTLEGVILSVGGFAQIAPLPVEKLSYWGMTGGTPPGEITSFENPEELLTNAERGVRRLFEAFFGRQTPFHACPDPYNAPVYHDYAHLERLKEWG
ncbi:MAG: double-strand break repair protein AddB [Alphaproteobacteria bacterium]|jgi:ATP-dependent helicase/nuclease subunit B|nr:double-strand break repair protein AddB [Alphaproteobacteria bacterium]